MSAASPTATRPKSPTFSAVRAVGVGGYQVARLGDLSRGEYPLARGQMAGIAILDAIIAQPECVKHIEDIRTAPTREQRAKMADERAARYAQRQSKGHEVVRRVLWALGEHPEHEAKKAAQVAFTGLAQVDPNARRNQPGGKTEESWARGALLIARRGAGLCLTNDCDNKRSRTQTGPSYGGPHIRASAEYDRRHYCAEHFEPKLQKADDRAIDRTFEAAYVALSSIDALMWALEVPQTT
jgi:hypothetical protein